MKTADFERVFGRGRLRMVTGDHVEVFREASAPGERRRYTKRFLATAAGDFRPWTEREWRILARLVGHGIGPVPDVVQFDRGAVDRPALVQTYDAGVTLDHWITLLPVERDGRRHGHAFEDCAHWWALARHALAALDAIHQLQVVHLDLKADNLCIPSAPPDLDGGVAAAPLQLRFEQIALIDFAFSLVSGERLVGALPIARQFDFDYQSPRLLEALEAGRRGDLGPTRELDWRCDFFSLAAMLRRVLPDPEQAPAPGSGWTMERLADARTFVRRLIGVHDDVLPAARPHPKLVARADAALDAPDLQQSLAAGWTLAAERPDTVADSPTPVTRIALPLVVAKAARPAPADRGPGSAPSENGATPDVRGAAADFSPERPAAADAAGPAWNGARSPAGARAELDAHALETDRERRGAHAADANRVESEARAAGAASDVVGRGAPASNAAQRSAGTGVPRTPIAGGPIEGERRTPVGASAGVARRRKAAWAAGLAAATVLGVPVLAEGWRAWQRTRETVPPTVAAGLAAPTPRPAGTRAAPTSPPAGVAASARPTAEVGGASGSAGSGDRGATTTAAATETGAPTASAAGEHTVPASPSAADRGSVTTSAAAVREAPTGSAASTRLGAAPGHAANADRVANGTGTTGTAATATAGTPTAGTTRSAGGTGATSMAEGARVPKATVATDGARATVAAGTVGSTPGGVARAAPGATRNAAANPGRGAGERRTPPVRDARGNVVPTGATSPTTVATAKPTAASRSGAAPAGGGKAAATTAMAPASARAPEPWPHTAMARAIATLREAFGGHRSADTAVADTARADPSRVRPSRIDPSQAGAGRPAANRADPARVDAVRADSRGYGSGSSRAGATWPDTVATDSTRLGGSRAVPAEPSGAAGTRSDPSPAAGPGSGSRPSAPDAPARVAPDALRMAAPATLPRDFAVRADELLTQHLPRVAQRAERSVLRVLYAAQRGEDPSADDAVRAAAQSMPHAPDPALLEGRAAPSDARALNDAARLAYWQRGSVREAVELQTRAYGADPANPEVVGNLAFLRLRQSPAQAETARQLALQALSLQDPRHPHGRVEDWTTLAIASALAGRERDARNAWLVSLALAPNAARQCRAATEATRLYGERMRAAAEPMLVRAQTGARAENNSACFFPTSRWTLNETSTR